MFGFMDLLQLFMSALIILPIVTVIRESGYYVTAVLLGAKNKRLVVGSGPLLFSMKTIEVRRYFFMFSWMEYDELNPSSRFWHGFIYASPILSCAVVAIAVNSLLAASIIPDNMFWSSFMFYIFYFMLFDLIPVYLPDGQPTNGRAIFDLIWHGERSDFLKQQKEQNEKQERSHTDAQEKTMNNRDKDKQKRNNHANPDSNDQQDSYTQSQKETMAHSDQKERQFQDHTKKETN
ncbi:hypothetical protein JOC54_003311 [Alkalihalobacillus xiaoxiensis]|uniref:Uncharacterized protein n=1 Tax=Shouchella xiaoxiensis TaxID=766895 RepID=A0ABS2SXV7_9BACI|nr:hypothetical protein [Shouchella xiaoxiensis]MBM7840031.1 hypothetical protein [Shouchella xiaoxiensis]